MKVEGAFLGSSLIDTQSSEAIQVRRMQGGFCAVEGGDGGDVLGGSTQLPTLSREERSGMGVDIVSTAMQDDSRWDVGVIDDRDV